MCVCVCVCVCVCAATQEMRRMKAQQVDQYNKLEAKMDLLLRKSNDLKASVASGRRATRWQRRSVLDSLQRVAAHFACMCVVCVYLHVAIVCVCFWSCDACVFCAYSVSTCGYCVCLFLEL